MLGRGRGSEGRRTEWKVKGTVEISWTPRAAQYRINARADNLLGPSVGHPDAGMQRPSGGTTAEVEKRKTFQVADFCWE